MVRTAGAIVAVLAAALLLALTTWESGDRSRRVAPVQAAPTRETSESVRSPVLPLESPASRFDATVRDPTETAGDDAPVPPIPSTPVYIWGEVLDELRRPIEGCTVRCEEAGVSARTDEDGEFELSGDLRFRQKVTVQAPTRAYGGAFYRISKRDLRGDVRRFTFECKDGAPQGTLRGMATAVDGGPVQLLAFYRTTEIKGLPLEALTSRILSLRTRFFIRRIPTYREESANHQDGLFEWGVPPGEYTLVFNGGTDHARPRWYAPRFLIQQRVASVTVHEGKTVDLESRTLEHGGVVGLLRTPCANGEKIWLSRPEEGNRLIALDYSGRSLSGPVVPTGDYTLNAGGASCPVSVRLWETTKIAVPCE